MVVHVLSILWLVREEIIIDVIFQFLYTILYKYLISPSFPAYISTVPYSNRITVVGGGLSSHGCSYINEDRLDGIKEV